MGFKALCLRVLQESVRNAKCTGLKNTILTIRTKTLTLSKRVGHTQVLGGFNSHCMNFLKFAAYISVLLLVYPDPTFFTNFDRLSTNFADVCVVTLDA